MAASLWAGHGAFAHGYKNGTIEIHHPWVHATTAKDAVVSMKLKNLTDQPERLIAVTSALAPGSAIVPAAAPSTPGKATPDNATGDGPGPRPGTGIEIPAHNSVELGASKAFIRLDGLSKPLQAYDRLPMTLTFEHSGKMDIEVMIEE